MILSLSWDIDCVQMLHTTRILTNCVVCLCFISIIPTQNLLQDESIIQLYISEVNMFLGINMFGQVINTSDFTSTESK